VLKSGGSCNNRCVGESFCESFSTLMKQAPLRLLVPQPRTEQQSYAVASRVSMAGFWPRHWVPVSQMGFPPADGSSPNFSYTILT
jgi:hypothetical protein